MKIIEKNGKVYSLAYFDQTMFDEIKNQSGSLIFNNEFQVHFTALVGQKEENDVEMNILIPLVFYNYPQEVSAAHIDFDLKDVEKISKKIRPIAYAKANEIVPMLKDRLPIDLEWHIAEYCSLHKHPSRSGKQGVASDSFSGTDLDKNPNNPGVVYPLQKIERKTANFAGIMHINNDKLCYLAHADIRGVENQTDNVVYTKGETITFVRGRTNEVTDIEKLFGIENDTVENYIVSKTLTGTVLIGPVSEALKNYRADFFIDSDNIKKKEIKYEIKQASSLFGGIAKTIKDAVFDDFDPLETNEMYQYIWDPMSLDKENKETLLDVLAEELALNMNEDGDADKLYEEYKKLPPATLINIAQNQGVLAKTLKKRIKNGIKQSRKVDTKSNKISKKKR